MNEFELTLYRRDLDKLFYKFKFVSRDIDDFWLFAKKYQVVLKKIKSSSKKKSSDLFKELSEKVDLDVEENNILVAIDSWNDRRIPTHVKCELKTVVLAYLNFKKKERTEKLDKLEQSKQALPIFQFRDEIIKGVKCERVVIVGGDTGCGKSTQVPQYLLAAGFNSIACTQPRRIACIALSKRVAYETQTESSSEIGYQIRFEKKRNQDTKILFITEGLLLRQVSSSNGLLSEYDVVVLDEVHERHLQGDILLGVLKCLLVQRQDLRLVLMSATINIELFTSYLQDLHPMVIMVPGRLYSIQLNYIPVIAEEKALKKEKLDPGPYIRILQMIDEKYSRTDRGDVLIFVSGMGEINILLDAITAYNEKVGRWISLPLHSSLSLEDQDKVFSYPVEGLRKCIVSTNIAETSLTIDGIRFVIDSGMVKEMSYDSVCKLQRLKEFWVSKASADQRKGRAGRSGPGVCYRLYTESDYLAMSDFTTPEILRVPLDSVLLQMIAMGLPDSRKFPFLEAPHSDALEHSILSLKRLGCLDAEEKLTPLGKMLSTLPLDLMLGKMLVMGSMFHQIEAALSLASALSVQSVYTDRAFRDFNCETARQDLESDHGDGVTLLNSLREWLEVKKEGGGKESVGSRRWAKTRGLEEQRFYEMVKLRSQFKDILKESGLLEDVSSELTSAERSLRHGELKILKQMKRSHQGNQTELKRKRLNPDTWTIAEDDSSSNAPDMRDVDFRLSNDQSKLQDLVSGSTATSYSDLMMLKIILLSGLYPQLAIPDEFNHSKGVNEQLFHTKAKPYVFLHPMSVFGSKPQILQLEESDIVHVPGFPARNPVSSRHQVLCYMSLLETNKPYLVNMTRLPGLQSLLLMCNQLHTNNDLTVLVCDGWVKFKVPHSDPIEKLLLSVVELRCLWDHLLVCRLQDKDCREMETRLSEGLVKLMQTDIVYSYKRLLSADLKGIYTMSSVLPTGANPLLKDYEMRVDSTVGGIKLTPYLTYDCLLDRGEDWKEWKCQRCSLTAPLSTLQRLQHTQACLQTQHIDSEDACSTDEGLRKPNSVLFTCPDCPQKNMYLTPVEILKHKRQHNV